MQAFNLKVNVALLAATLLLSSCTTTLVCDDVKRTAGLNGHCSGSEWVDRLLPSCPFRSWPS
jgi:hypothetical protein